MVPVIPGGGAVVVDTGRSPAVLPSSWTPVDPEQPRSRAVPVT
ncbi:hypothetical protein [Rhodococcus sp. WAY2]|nr:hypothetical protein [Rhodococcus sp. WAY2]QHE67779.1 hypothetical protein GFS60_01286 [Rhodococcus sp. WAY2]